MRAKASDGTHRDHAQMSWQLHMSLDFRVKKSLDTSEWSDIILNMYTYKSITDQTQSVV